MDVALYNLRAPLRFSSPIVVNITPTRFLSMGLVDTTPVTSVCTHVEPGRALGSTISFFFIPVCRVYVCMLGVYTSSRSVGTV